MAKMMYDSMKHFSLFLSYLGGPSILGQLQKTRLELIRADVEGFPGKILSPCGECVLRLAQSSLTSPQFWRGAEFLMWSWNPVGIFCFGQ